jgi:hypothetical protein
VDGVNSVGLVTSTGNTQIVNGVTTVNAIRVFGTYLPGGKYAQVNNCNVKTLLYSIIILEGTKTANLSSSLEITAFICALSLTNPKTVSTRWTFFSLVMFPEGSFHGCLSYAIFALYRQFFFARAGERTQDLLFLFIFSFHHFTAEPQRLPLYQ